MCLTRRLLVGLLLTASALPAAAWDEEYRHGRIRYADAGAVLQRASEPNAEEASINTPFLPGDRLWTDGGGRVEIQFADASLLRLDARSKIDYVSHEEGGGERLVLRLWSGRLEFTSRGRDAAEIEIETPAGYVLAREGGSFLVDADPGGVQLTVLEGRAELEAGRRRVEVGAGERTWARRGDTPETPQAFDRREQDDLAAWSDERDEQTGWAGNSERYLPQEIDPYAGELENHGSWYFVADVGQVWRPYVDAGWSPYTNGRWLWTSYGWTWVPGESWGWAPFHYGRWDYVSSVGWYWVPGRSWGPAWVSWAVGSDYVGWCPLGRGDRPVDLGRAVPRGDVGAPRAAWVYARRNDIGSPDIARRRTTPAPEVIQGLHVAESARARPSRDLRVINVDTGRRESAVPRNVRLKPTAGDTVPELRNDPTTTIPNAVLRRPRPDTRYEERGTNASTNQGGNASRNSGSSKEATADERAADRAGGERDGGRSNEHADSDESDDHGLVGAGTRTGSQEQTGSPRARETEPDRDVLRRMFRPLTDSRASEPRRAEPRSTPSPRAEPPKVQAPRVQAPPPQPPPSTQPPRAVPGARERDHH